MQQDLTLALNRIDIAEFRRIVPYMPDIAGLISAETHYVQNNKESLISAEVSIDRLAYNQQPMGDWALSAVYLPKETGEHRNFIICLCNWPIHSSPTGWLYSTAIWTET